MVNKMINQENTQRTTPECSGFTSNNLMFPETNGAISLKYCDEMSKHF